MHFNAVNSKAHTYQVQIFTRFRQKEAFHSIFETHVYNIMHCSVTALSFRVGVNTLNYFPSNV